MISKIFIERPVLAAVISIVITIAGIISLLTLPIDQYPNINPPAVKISTSFPGASATTAAESVATPIEQELNGLPGMIYMSSSSSKTGSVSISVTFEVGTDQDMASVNVQNASKQADSSLPVDVMQEGVSIEKEASIELLKLALTSDDPKFDDLYLSNFLSINIADAVRRIPGVGRTRNSGSRSYSMRIWLRPDRMAAYGLTTSDVNTAIKEQNKEAAVGMLGAQPNDVALALPITTEGRLSSAEDFEKIIVRANRDGSLIRLRDIARVELGASAYTLQSKLNGKNAAILQVYLLPGANALTVAENVKQTMDRLSQSFPRGINWDVWYDSSIFIRAAIHSVIKALLEALALVILVVFIFLQNWRTTLIPALAVPVSIIGTFAALVIFGFTLNTVNLLALVLAIGIVVDDAIVVVENVERLMKEEGLSPVEATTRAMQELSGAIVATSLVLAAVFIPVSFLGGITGILFREFALSIIVAVLISTVVALTLSPALCAILLKPVETEKRVWKPFALFNRWIDRGGQHYTGFVQTILGARKRALLFFLVIVAATLVLFKYLPSGFMPEEDQGRFFIDLELAEGSSVSRSKEIVDRATQVVLRHPAVANVFSLAGESKRAGGNEGSGTLEIILKDWSERSDDGYSINRVMEEILPDLRPFIEVSVRAFKPPAIAGLGSGNGVELELQDRTGSNAEVLFPVAEELMKELASYPGIASISSDLKKEIPIVNLLVDRPQAMALDIPLADIYGTMNVFTGSTSINDFNLFGRVYRVKMQAEAPFRNRANSLKFYHARSRSGAMVPLDVVGDIEYSTGPSRITRYNLFNSAKITAVPKTGYGDGEVIKAIDRAAEKVLPPGFSYEWTGVTYQKIQSAGTTSIALGLAVIFAFLFLAALYESWTIPLSVLLITPIATFGAVACMWIRGMESNLFFQIAFIALVGLSAKNSILIVEFCRQLYLEGMRPVDAALRAAQLRFRPIMMTAVSFILGVLPLYFAAGPGAMAQRSVSTPILGGMLLATSVGIIFTPLFFVTIVQLSESMKKAD